MSCSGEQSKNGEKQTTAVTVEVTQKRRRKNTSEFKSDRTIQWTNSYLKSVQADVGHPREYSLDHNVHSNILQLPLQPGIVTKESLHDHFQRTSWSTTFPVPLISQHIVCTESNCSERIDPMYHLVKAKKSFLSTLNRMKLSYLRKKRSFKLMRKMQTRANIYPNLLFKLAEQLERDPDQWFSDKYGYDHYFTGGSLVVVETKKFRWIVNIIGETMHIVKIIPVDVANNLLMDTSDTKDYDLGADCGPIFETFWSVPDKSNICQSTELGNIKIGFRRKKQINILWGRSNHTVLKQKTICTEVPFISSCFLVESSGWVMCTSDMEKKLKIWNYNQMVVLGSLQLAREDSADDGWSCIRPFGQNRLICLERTVIRFVKIIRKDIIIDKTSSIASWLWTCDRASSLEVNLEERILFIGTTHKLLLLRLVESSDNETQDFQQILTFTHNLKHYPTMIRFALHSDENYYVWISSQLPGDTKLCCFAKVPPKRFATKNIPVKPLSIQESYAYARTEGKCIFPARILRRRLQLFHSGIAIIADSDQLYLLLQNSLGDIFQQKIIYDQSESNSSEVSTSIQAWMVQLNSLNVSLPVATDFKNLHGFKKIFQSTSYSNPLSTESINNKHSLRKRPRWEQTVEQLGQYRDLLAADMLSIWGFRPNVAQPERRLSTELPINVTDRISNWLEQTEEMTEPFILQDEIVEEKPIVQLGTPSDDENNSVEMVEETIPMVSIPVDKAAKNMAFKSVHLERSKTISKTARKKYVQGF
ncbi:uncharacterized protein LOC128742992 [Sabethes cyaneus]|uniref:uncharacterized protein LOC128742992 n=1 Tax=Sabethes cyaneus TaxID=53552 RepID=UPI00237E7411|nr:uncharacterized protein LOC128742992 [Sabethes cyaneus]